MSNQQITVPDPTAVRVALWRTLHLEIDSLPHVFEDQIGLRLAAPDKGWRERPDMHPQGTSGFRAGIVARSRFVEDFLLERFNQGVRQYVIRGAGLDTFAERVPKSMSSLITFEVDQPETQEWKRRRLLDLGFGIPENLRLVPVDFEANDSWWDKLIKSGFDPAKPAVVASTGVSLYLTREANATLLHQASALASGSSFLMTFYLPLELIEPAGRPLQEMVQARARAAGTPFLSFFSPSEITALAIKAGFKAADHFSRVQMIQRYFKDRTDGLAPASGEEFLIAAN